MNHINDTSPSTFYYEFPKYMLIFNEFLSLIICFHQNTLEVHLLFSEK